MFRKGKRNIQIWRIWAEGKEVITQWGMEGGKFQETVDVPGPKGKPDTKAYIDPKQSARNLVIRNVEARAKRGYSLLEKDTKISKELKEKLNEVRQENSITFEGPLPHNTAFSKPINSINQSKLEKVEDNLIWTMKINGMCHIISKDMDEKVWIQKRGKLEIENDKYPHLVKEFDKLLPRESIVLAELYSGPGKTMADFKKMQSIANSLTDRAISIQKKIGLVKAYVFRTPFWEVYNMEIGITNAEWLEHLEELNDGPNGILKMEFVKGLIIFEGTIDEAIREAGEEGFEGWVVYLKDRDLGKNHLNFLGNPDRPIGCWKVKNEEEDDFIAVWEPKGIPEHCGTKCLMPNLKARQESVSSGKCSVCKKPLKSSGTYGSGKNRKRVGSISLYQIDQNGVKQYICECSSGLTDKEKSDIAKIESFTEVVKIAYQARGYIRKGDDSNALTHPRYISVRKDKDLDECKNPEL
jgi:hypothetical protein